MGALVAGSGVEWWGAPQAWLLLVLVTGPWLRFCPDEFFERTSPASELPMNWDQSLILTTGRTWSGWRFHANPQPSAHRRVSAVNGHGGDVFVETVTVP